MSRSRATSSVFASLDKVTRAAGPADFKLSGYLGAAPTTSVGLGLGSGGGRGGSELLRGAGGVGVGALGARGIGRGSVGGTVAGASARAIGVQGSIDRDAVAKAVNSHLQEVRACYERALLKAPGLAGKVVLEWTLSTSGSVVSARTKSSTLQSPEVEACILRQLSQWDFPRAAGGVVIVSYPFLFNSVGY
jgi:hypothetical protein